MELTMLMPLLLVCLLGAAQLGAILYTSVSVDGAARSGALAASEYPIKSGAYTYSAGSFGDGSGVTCSASSPNLTNPVCAAWYQSASSLSSLSVTLSQGGTVGSASGCPAGALPDGYVTVQASAAVPIFIPYIGGLFADSSSSGVRTDTDRVTMRVEPCNMTNGN
ncbi:MAG: TadE/TadG family type IV pilus assembly protein [Candidatus Dormiibacterota bacterium]